MATPTTIEPASTPDELSSIRTLFQNYADWLGFDLSFQSFEKELANLPGAYAPPGGALLLAYMDGQPVGCVGLRPLADNIGEVKRLYVKPQCRGTGVGRQLMDALLTQARHAGYRALRLDTIPVMQSAGKIYRDLGFRNIPPYYHNPIEDAEYMELALDSSTNSPQARGRIATD